MVAPRQDAWTEDDDLLLAEVILRHIREGSTQLAAFEEVGLRLNRTAAACGFRWNSLIRKKYEAAIQIAKAQRQKRNYARPEKYTINEEMFITQEDRHDTNESITYDDIIRFLKQQKAMSYDYTKQHRVYEKEVEEKNREVEELRKENRELKQRIIELESGYKVVNEDYRALIQIMDRARKMAFLNEEEPKPIFKMDLNGNLERINK